MKKYFRDYSLEGRCMVSGGNELEEVIANRQDRFTFTTKYQEAKNVVLEALKKIEALLPEERLTILALDAEIMNMECICYSAAYRDGMSDLMTAMTLNKLSITKCEYADFSNEAG